MDGFSVRIDDVLDVWVLADMYQMEGLKWGCMGSLERDLCEKNDASRILKEAEDLSCPCDELKRICQEVLLRRQQRRRSFFHLSYFLLSFLRVFTLGKAEDYNNKKGFTNNKWFTS